VDKASLLGLVVFYYQQALAAGLRKILDLGQSFGNAGRRRRLDDEREGAARQAVLAVLIERNNLHWDVPCQRILLKLTQHVPSEHVRQEDIKRYGCRLILLGEIERIVAAHRQQCFEALVAREIDHDARIMRIVLHDQQNGVARLNFESVVRNLLDRTFRRRDMKPDRLSGRNGSAGYCPGGG